MPRIFISYRRDDSAGYVGRIHEHLKKHFNSNQVFMDVTTIRPGEPFPEVIRQALNECNVLIAVIGRSWLTISDPNTGRRRLDDPDDYVRTEVATALKRNIRLIPVLVDNAPMPNATALPQDLSDLSYKNAVEINNQNFDEQIKGLIEVCKNDLGITEDKYSSDVTQGPSCIRLRDYSAPEATPLIETRDRIVTIGRAPYSTLVCSERDVSWLHGEIFLQRGEYYYRHLSDTNPSILRRNGVEHFFRAGKKEELPLRNQDRLTIGNSTFIIEFDIISEDGGYITTFKKSDNPNE